MFGINNNTSHERKIMEIIKRIDLDLGSSFIDKNDLKKDEFTMFLYISHTNHIQGCIIAEPLQHAYKVTQDPQGECCGSVLIS